MAKSLRAFDVRLILACLMIATSLSACETVEGWFGGKKKEPLTGQRIPVFTDRTELEADKDMGSVPVVLPSPFVNNSWPESGGFANYAMYNLAISDSPQTIW